jgi:hypothetical protein
LPRPHKRRRFLNLPLRVFHAVEKSIRVIEILDCTSTTI